MFNFMKKSKLAVLIEDVLGISILAEVAEYRYKYEKCLNSLIRVAKANDLSDLDIVSEFGWLILEGKIEPPSDNFAPLQLRARLLSPTLITKTVLSPLFHLQRGMALSLSLPDSVDIKSTPFEKLKNSDWAEVTKILASIGWDAAGAFSEGRSLETMTQLYEKAEHVKVQAKLNNYDMAIMVVYFFVHYWSSAENPKNVSNHYTDKWLNIVRRCVYLTYMSELTTKTYHDEYLRDMMMKISDIKERLGHEH